MTQKEFDQFIEIANACETNNSVDRTISELLSV